MTALVALLTAGLTLLSPAPEVEAPRPDPAVRAARTAAPNSIPTSVTPPWGALAECESGGRWDLDVGTFDGGLQFHPATWDAYRDPTDPPYAWQATPARQVAVAERVLAAQGWGAWPACARRLGLR